MAFLDFWGKVLDVSMPLTIFVGSIMTLSVIICTHNPDMKRLGRVFSALERQTLPLAEWECILVDNDSSAVVGSQIDMAWHPSGRIVREDALGLTHARLKGIAEAKGEILVFVDDDCLLEPDYLAQTSKIFNDHPFLGFVGGYGRAEYESPPPAWMTMSLRQYHLDSSEDPLFGNSLNYARMTPCLGPWFPIGAGMAIRKNRAVEYAQSIQNDPVALGLGRTGKVLTGAEDLDMGIHVMMHGQAIGKSRELQFIHVVPKFRLELNYMLRLLYMSQYSTERLLVHRGWHKPLPLTVPTRWQRLKKRLTAAKRRPPEDLCWQALSKGLADGLSGAPPDPFFCQR